MCDQTLLQMNVDQLVREKMFACEPFTSADISHPLIKKDCSIRHREVRAAMNKILTQNELDAADFETSDITVYPEGPGTPGRTARLWHPSDYDPSEYKGNTKVLVRGPAGSPSVNAFVAADQKFVVRSFGSGIPVAAVGVSDTITPSSVVYSRNCSPQVRNDTLNIPTKVVALAGFKPCDKVQVLTSPNPHYKVSIRPYSGFGKGLQQVDKEGRIRLHGSKANMFRGIVTAAVVVESGLTFIKLT